MLGCTFITLAILLALTIDSNKQFFNLFHMNKTYLRRFGLSNQFRFWHMSVTVHVFTVNDLAAVQCAHSNIFIRLQICRKLQKRRSIENS